MKDTERTIIWKVHCPADGPQLLKYTGLHLYLRQGLTDHVVTYFCPACGQQRYQLVDKKVAGMLRKDLGVATTVMRVPLEALEPHNGPVITEKDIDAAIASMADPDWGPR